MGGRIEETKRFDRLTEEFDAQRLRIGGRENIDDPAADAEFAGNFDDGHAPVSQSKEPRCQGFTLDGGADLEGQHRAHECIDGYEPLHERIDRGHHLGGGKRSDLMECIHTPGDEADVRGSGFVGQRFPAREQGQRCLGQTREIVIKPKVVEEPRCGFIAFCDDQPRSRAELARSRMHQLGQSESRRRTV